MTATVEILHCGYAGDRIASTVTLIHEGDMVAVVDPGMVADRGQILDPLAQRGFSPGDVTDVVFSHHHPDHTLNAALFAAARYHDHWAIYTGNLWEDRDAEGFHLSPSVRLMRTPGHTAEDITTLAETDVGLVAATHLWWTSEGPLVDPRGEDQEALTTSRERLLALRPALIIPGHGAAFPPPPHT